MVLKRRASGLNTRMQMFNIFAHQGNVKLHCGSVSPSQNGCYQETKIQQILAKSVGERTSYTLWMGM